MAIFRSGLHVALAPIIRFLLACRICPFEPEQPVSLTEATMRYLSFFLTIHLLCTSLVKTDGVRD